MDEQQETRTVRKEYGQPAGDSIAQARRVIDQLENRINDSRRVPMSKTLSFVDTGEIIDLIGQLRIVLPHTVVQAQAIMDEKERILSEAKAEADRIADTADTSYKTTIDEANRFKQEVHDEADAYDFPLYEEVTDENGETDYATISDQQLPTRWDLGIRESRTGILLYAVPAGAKDYSISFQEVFASDSDEDGTNGDLFFVFFSAKAQ